MKKSNRQIRILHLEDHITDAALIARSLTKSNIDFEIKVVDSKKEYETAIKEFRPEIIISDHSLPSFNSMEALQILKNSRLEIPFILVTGAVSEDFAASVLKNGADDYILKDRLHRLPVAILGALEKFHHEAERKETELLIKESEKQYRDLIQHLPAAVYTCDTEGRILIYNKAAVELWGREPKIDELWCGSWKIYTNENKVISRECSPMARAVRENKATGGTELIVERPDGLRRNVIAYPVPNLNSAGEVIGATNMLTDITDLKAIQLKTLTLVDHLQYKNKELEQFTYMVSHVLRAPVARILGLESIFHIDPADATFIVRKIAEEATSLDNILRDINIILSARNPENEKWNYVDFEENLQHATQGLSKEILESNALITADFKQVKGINTVKSYLYSIMINLLSNAIKFRISDIPLRIHLESKTDEEFVCLAVKDNGMGIDLDKYSEKVFGLYKRFHGDAIPGKGSGLYLVKTYIESVGGRVEIESKIKAGTTVKVFFPKTRI